MTSKVFEEKDKEFSLESKESNRNSKISVSNPAISDNGAPKKKYMKIPYASKQQLHNMVQKEGMKIKDAAKILGIKYATAKTIIFHKRQKRKAKRLGGKKICGYTEVKKDQGCRLKIVSVTANDLIYSKEYIL